MGVGMNEFLTYIAYLVSVVGLYFFPWVLGWIAYILGY